MSDDVRVLLLADSHLGFDLPVRPRSNRRRRGHDFLANYAAALQPALTGEVDLVVHAGDVFDRPSVPTTVAYQAYEPLRRVADRGVPVFLVPGNHERSRLPHARFASHPGVHVFDRPRTFVVQIRGRRVALAGFPYERDNVRTRFGALLDETEWRREREAQRLLCIHHCVEGATVGPGDFTFTNAADVIRPR
jgi:exonuclease SbcD